MEYRRVSIWLLEVQGKAIFSGDTDRGVEERGHRPVGRTGGMIRECVEVGAGPARLATSRALRSAGVARTVGRADVAGDPIRPNLVEGKFPEVLMREGT